MIKQIATVAGMALVRGSVIHGVKNGVGLVKNHLGTGNGESGSSGKLSWTGEMDVERAVWPLQAEGTVTEGTGSRRVEVNGIAEVTGSGTQVKLSDGSVVPLSRVRFANGELGRVYALAGRYDTTSAGAFVVGYDGSLPVEIYQAGFDAVHRLAAQGMSRDSALANAGAAAQLLPDDAKKLAYNTGNLLFEENGGKIIQEEMKPGDGFIQQPTGSTELPDGSEQVDSSYEADIPGFTEWGNESNTLTAAQKSRLNTLDNTIKNNLKETDFSGTLRDLQGNPVPNPQGGYYDHLTEMKQSYTSLKKVQKGLEGSLKNPNLSNIDRTILQAGLDQANAYIARIEDLFEPFGGIE